MLYTVEWFYSVFVFCIFPTVIYIYIIIIINNNNNDDDDDDDDCQ